MRRAGKHLFVAVDRATRWVHLEVRASKTAEEARSFLKNLINKAPFVISRILTDNGKEFTDRFCPTGEREPTGKHVFDQECAEHGIEHRLIKPKKPQTNGMAQRFNGRIKEVVQQTRFESAQQLEETLIRTSSDLQLQYSSKKSWPCHACGGSQQVEENSSRIV